MKRLALVDGHAILHRAYHAFPQTLTTRKGELVNAVYGFTRILLTVLKDLQPEYAAVAFDLSAPTFRHQEYVGYQVQRPAMAEALKGQIGRVQEIVRALNLPVLALEGYEADDIIGSLTKQAIKKKIEVVIVTGDKDLLQLITKQVKVYLPARGFVQAKLFDEEEVEKLLKIKPQQIIDYKALVGDASDNYPGVPGIGPKTAVMLLRAYGSLENIYRNLKNLPKSVTQKLTAGRESAELSRKLATIVTDTLIKLDLKACRISDYNQRAAIELFKKLEFRSLLNKLPGSKEETKEKKEEGEQMKLV